LQHIWKDKAIKKQGFLELIGLIVSLLSVVN